MSGLPREVILWLQSLDLTYTFKNVRRDFCNGFLIAEIIAWYFTQEVQLHSFSNGTSLQTKLGNWKLLEKYFSKENIHIQKELIEGTIHCKPGAAIALLERLYTILTKRELYYIPAKGRTTDFTDKKYQRQLPLYARSTTARSIKTNLANTEIEAQPDLHKSKTMTESIIESQEELKKLEREEFPERFQVKQEQKNRVPKNQGLGATEGKVREIIVKQKTSST